MITNSMTPKFNLTQEQNIFIAKRNIVDYVYKSAKLEGLGVTYPDTEAIFRGVAVHGLKVDDIVAINNLKHAWQFILETLDFPMEYSYLCKINQYVGAGLFYEPGFIRNTPVNIGGTKWKPDMPIENDVKLKLPELLAIANPTERAITLMLYCMRGQFFNDGNKRTAMLAANQIMIANGQGIISVPEEEVANFIRMLVKFYETGNTDEIKWFVYNVCIDGIQFKDRES
ncbi:MAG: Fic family protein [Oscillospiraceae bacterium]|nr:Fic family protein [Oscillospiraceae bacterium]